MATCVSASPSPHARAASTRTASNPSETVRFHERMLTRFPPPTEATQARRRFFSGYSFSRWKCRSRYGGWASIGTGSRFQGNRRHVRAGAGSAGSACLVPSFGQCACDGHHRPVTRVFIHAPSALDARNRPSATAPLRIGPGYRRLPFEVGGVHGRERGGHREHGQDFCGAVAGAGEGVPGPRGKQA